MRQGSTYHIICMFAEWLLGQHLHHDRNFLAGLVITEATCSTHYINNTQNKPKLNWPGLFAQPGVLRRKVGCPARRKSNAGALESIYKHCIHMNHPVTSSFHFLISASRAATRPAGLLNAAQTIGYYRTCRYLQLIRPSSAGSAAEPHDIKSLTGSKRAMDPKLT